MTGILRVRMTELDKYDEKQNYVHVSDKKIDESNEHVHKS